MSSVSGSSEDTIDPGSQGGQRGGACLPGDHPSVAQHQQGWDGLGIEPLGNLRRDVDVHLDQLHLAGQIAGELLECWADHPAGAAPRRPQVDEDGNLGALRDLTERGIVGVGDPRQRLMALAAARCPGRRGRHPVHLAAMTTPDQSARHGLIIPAAATEMSNRYSSGPPAEHLELFQSGPAHGASGERK
jgi:hypothetical protein